VWLFDQDPVSRIEQHAGCQVERLLRAIHDNDLLRLTHHRPRPLQVAGDSLAQWCIALRWSVVQILHRHGTRPTRQQAPPGFMRKRRPIWQAIAKIIAHGLTMGHSARWGQGRVLRHTLPVGGQMQAGALARAHGLDTRVGGSQRHVREGRGDIGA
jgi:hypothetical protein